MNFKGVIKYVSDIQSIQTKDDRLYQKKEVVIETEERYPQSLLFDVSGDDLQKEFLAVGQRVEVELNCRANNYNGRWFNSFRAWKIIESKDGKE